MDESTPMSRKSVRQIEQLVETACRSEKNIFGYGIWSHHITSVVKYTKLLADNFGLDSELLEIAALLHDYAGILDAQMYEEHHIHGAREAELILRELGYPEDRIAVVQRCIRSHRGSVDVEKFSKEELCLADADAMAHIANVPSLLYLVYVGKGMSIDEGAEWVAQKLERSWMKLSEGSKEIIRERYEMALGILGRKDM